MTERKVRACSLGFKPIPKRGPVRADAGHEVAHQLRLGAPRAAFVAAWGLWLRASTPLSQGLEFRPEWKFTAAAPSPAVVKRIWLVLKPQTAGFLLQKACRIQKAVVYSIRTLN